MIVGFRVEGTFYNPGDVSLQKSYKNIVGYGESLTYEINPRANSDL